MKYATNAKEKLKIPITELVKGDVFTVDRKFYVRAEVFDKGTPGYVTCFCFDDNTFTTLAEHIRVTVVAYKLVFEVLE